MRGHLRDDCPGGQGPGTRSRLGTEVNGVERPPIVRMQRRSHWLLLVALWALLVVAYCSVALAQGFQLSLGVIDAYFACLVAGSLGAWTENVWAWRLLPFQLGGVAAFQAIWAGRQLWEYKFGSLYADSPATLIVVVITLLITFLPSTLFLAAVLARGSRGHRPAAWRP